jgi:DNA-binding GntR family transcriptional regulator
MPDSPEPIALRAATLLPERIAESLRAEILSQRLAPGARLVEQELAARLGVSRVPLREAFRVLAGEGLIAIEPHRGAVVREQSDTELRELFEVRAMFEARAVALLSRTRPAAALDALDAMVADMKAAVRKRQHDDYLVLAAGFHDTLVAQCGNGLLQQLYAQIRLNLRRYQAVMAKLPESPAQSIREHEAIVAAIRSGDAVTASRAAEHHVALLVERFERSLSLPPAAHKPSRTRIA